MTKYIVVLLMLFNNLVYAQFTKAELQASGLTCSMCNLATQKQLETLPFIDSIVPEIERNVFLLYFKPNATIDFSLIKQKVEDAGFFVAELKVNTNLANVSIEQNILFDKQSAFLFDGKITSQQTVTLKFIDKGFVTDKAFKRLKSSNEKLNQVAVQNAAELSNLKVYYVTVE